MLDASDEREGLFDAQCLVDRVRDEGPVGAHRFELRGVRQQVVHERSVAAEGRARAHDDEDADERVDLLVGEWTRVDVVTDVEGNGCLGQRREQIVTRCAARRVAMSGRTYSPNAWEAA